MLLFLTRVEVSRLSSPSPRQIARTMERRECWFSLSLQGLLVSSVEVEFEQERIGKGDVSGAVASRIVKEMKVTIM